VNDYIVEYKKTVDCGDCLLRRGLHLWTAELILAT